MIANNPTSRFYVRMNGKIRGPFDLDRLRSMRQRSRIGPRDELSADRRKWVLAGSVTDVFPDGFVGMEADANALDWHYMRSGQQQGPVTLATLQALAQSDGLAPHDSVWKLGTPGWVLASQVSELAFPPPRSLWQSLHGGIRLGIVVVGFLLLIAPIWMVLAYYANQTNAAKEQIHQRIENEKWIAEQKLKKELFETEQKLKKEMHDENLKQAKDFHDEHMSAAQRRNDQGMYAQSGSATSGAATTNASGALAIGDYITNPQYLQKWIGRIKDTNGRTYRVQITWADSSSKYYKGQSLDLLDDEFKPLKNVCAKAFVQGYKQ